MIMRKIVLFALAFISIAVSCYSANPLRDGEKLHYTFHLKLKWVWIDAGSATLETRAEDFEGQKVYRCSLIASGSRQADRIFMLRDTLETVVSPQIEPLFFRKGCIEGKDIVNESIRFFHEGNKYRAQILKVYPDGHIREGGGESSEPIYDMLSLVLYIRSLDHSTFEEGREMSFQMAGSKRVSEQYLRYLGHEQVEIESGEKMDCRKFSLIKYEKDKKGRMRENTVLRFFTSSESEQKPLRIDIFMKFGEARVMFAK